VGKGPVWSAVFTEFMLYLFKAQTWLKYNSNCKQTAEQTELFRAALNVVNLMVT